MKSSLLIRIRYIIFLTIELCIMFYSALITDAHTRTTLPFILAFTAFAMLPTIWLLLLLNEEHFSCLLDFLSFIKSFMLLGCLLFIVQTSILNKGLLLAGEFSQLQGVLGVFVAEGIGLIGAVIRRKELCKLSQ